MHVAPRLLVTILGCIAIGALGTAPAAAQNALPVDACSRECSPKEINGGDSKTGAEPVNVVLYGHFQDILNRAPLNAQPPNEQQEIDQNKGFLMPVIETNSGACVEELCPDFHFRNNHFEMFSSPGFVEFLADGDWRTHQEPGLAADAIIAADEIRLYWYMSAHAIPGQNSNSGVGATAPVGTIPQVGVYARMETGRFAFHGDLIAESADFDENQVGSPTRVNLVNAPGQPPVYEFQIPMKVHDRVIPSSETANGFIVSISPYQVKTAKQDGNEVMQSDWRIRTGANFPPRLIVPMTEPMRTLNSNLSVFDERLFVRWTFVAAMGSYDMRDAALRLDSTGPNPIDAKSVDFITLKRGVDHDAHFKPVNATWAIDFTNFPLKDGDYELTASIPNHQETYLLEHRLAFSVVNGRPDVHQIGGARRGAAGEPAGLGGPEKGAPGLEGVLVLAVILAVAAVARRRSG